MCVVKGRCQSEVGRGVLCRIGVSQRLFCCSTIICLLFVPNSEARACVVQQNLS